MFHCTSYSRFYYISSVCNTGVDMNQKYKSLFQYKSVILIKILTCLGFINFLMKKMMPFIETLIPSKKHFWWIIKNKILHTNHVLTMNTKLKLRN